MSQPLITVICLCYNHAAFVREAVTSVMQQTYRSVELILVDDASADSSPAEIKKLSEEFPSIQTILLNENHGNCRAFNQGLAVAKGDFIIDLAADDILMPDRIQKGITFFQGVGLNVGVNFSDAEWISESGEHLYYHSRRFPHAQIPQGDIYKELIQRYFICSPTMMFRRSVIDHLQGYDESLAYEDFDFWIRSSRVFHYGYTPEALVKKRVVKNSMSKNQQRSIDQQRSTYRVCEKIMVLNRTHGEQKALSRRINYEMKLSLRLFNFSLALDYYKLARENYKILKFKD